MAGKTLDLHSIIEEDLLASQIVDTYISWETKRDERVAMWKEIQEYVFATDTTQTTNSKLPWSNKTTLPKLCQIRDNLHSNYMATLFPNSNWLDWQGSSEDDAAIEKKEIIENYMIWVTDRNQFYNTISRLVLDYIDYGNCFVMPEWVDETSPSTDGEERVGFVGPAARRISPLDIVFNPIAPHFENSPKIIRSVISMGELKELLTQTGVSDEERQSAEELWAYIKDYRKQVLDYNGPLQVKDRMMNIAGFDDYRDYIQCGSVEILSFYGDLYDAENDMFHKNVCIKVVDRHKVFYNKPNPSYYGYPPIFHAGWRQRPDSLWAMGPLDNLVGMQYRIDHLENMKADVFDLIAYPPVKIKGYVEDFTWGPMERIYVGDDGDVTLLSPDVNTLNADTQIQILEMKMEEMAGSPREAMGFRTPGEKTKYEVQSLENASARVYQNKIQHFEDHVIENALNSMLELARRNMTQSTVRAFDDTLKVAVFASLTKYDITGHGRLKPMASRHFAEKASMLQNLSNFFNSAAGQDEEVRQHFSSIKLAQTMEKLLEIEAFKLVTPFIRISERADQQREQNNNEEQVLMEMQTPSGIAPGDF